MPYPAFCSCQGPWWLELEEKWFPLLSWTPLPPAPAYPLVSVSFGVPEAGSSTQGSSEGREGRAVEVPSLGCGAGRGLSKHHLCQSHSSPARWPLGSCFTRGSRSWGAATADVGLVVTELVRAGTGTGPQVWTWEHVAWISTWRPWRGGPWLRFRPRPGLQCGSCPPRSPLLAGWVPGRVPRAPAASGRASVPGCASGGRRGLFSSLTAHPVP